MPAIEQQTWQEVSVLTWDDLSAYKWEDFRIALMESDTEQEVNGVAVERSYTVATVPTEMETQGVKIVQSPIVMRTRTEMIVSIVVSDRDYKTEMIKYLPLYERKDAIYEQILISFDREFRRLEQDLSIVERNIFLDTAIESLSIFERDLGIETIKNLRYNQRREQIASRNRAAFDQTTEETIKLVASAYSNGDVEVSKTDVVGVFEIKFVGSRGVPDNIEGLKQALDIVIPAHLGLTYVFTYSPWQDFTNQTWGSVVDVTWEDLRIWEGVV